MSGTKKQLIHGGESGLHEDGNLYAPMTVRGYVDSNTYNRAKSEHSGKLSDFFVKADLTDRETDSKLNSSFPTAFYGLPIYDKNKNIVAYFGGEFPTTNTGTWEIDEFGSHFTAPSGLTPIVLTGSMTFGQV